MSGQPNSRDCPKADRPGASVEGSFGCVTDSVESLSGLVYSRLNNAAGIQITNDAKLHRSNGQNGRMQPLWPLFRNFDAKSAVWLPAAPVTGL